ncbi:hypothetical protein ADIARSV_1287 [Arcticibacter svalbardensis MN12-7]|uniref:Uncharacterized protein n=1 Tax=Arcticibacter svalbardensis MN12-7 TaxID=1150600 RepID=R9GUU9_9SPHI|nr:hypothetical protein ADIARSV_1287 [Arcticibacter svalbardensis MN12-7]
MATGAAGCPAIGRINGHFFGLNKRDVPVSADYTASGGVSGS